MASKAAASSQPQCRGRPAHRRATQTSGDEDPHGERECRKWAASRSLPSLRSPAPRQTPAAAHRLGRSCGYRRSHPRTRAAVVPAWSSRRSATRPVLRRPPTMAAADSSATDSSVAQTQVGEAGSISGSQLTSRLSGGSSDGNARLRSCGTSDRPTRPRRTAATLCRQTPPHATPVRAAPRGRSCLAAAFHLRPDPGHRRP